MLCGTRDELNWINSGACCKVFNLIENKVKVIVGIPIKVVQAQNFESFNNDEHHRMAFKKFFVSLDGSLCCIEVQNIFFAVAAPKCERNALLRFFQSCVNIIHAQQTRKLFA